MPIQAQGTPSLYEMLQGLAYGTNPWSAPQNEGEDVIRQPSKWEKVRDVATDVIPGGAIYDKIRTGEYASSPYKSALPDVAQALPDVLDSPLAALKALGPLAIGQIMGSRLKDLAWRPMRDIPDKLIPKEVPTSSGGIRDVLKEALGVAKKENRWDKEQVDQIIATMQRTAPNLNVAMGSRRNTRDELHKLGMSKWFLDVPTKPTGIRPTLIRAHEDADFLHKELGYPYSPDIKGFYVRPANIAVYNRYGADNYLPHELGHWATTMKRQLGLPPNLDERLSELVSQNPSWDKQLRQIDSYRDLTPSGMGEEMLSRKIGETMSFYFDHNPDTWPPELQRIYNDVKGAISPEMFMDAVRQPGGIRKAVPPQTELSPWVQQR